MKLATIACLHGNLKAAKKLAIRLKKEAPDAIVLAGDIGSDEKQKDSLVKIISLFAKLKKQVFVLPGNHEQYDAYYQAIKHFKNNKLIVDCTKAPVAKVNGQKLVFIPGTGTGSAPGAGFRVLRSRKAIKRFRKYLEQYRAHYWGRVKPVFLSDFTRLIDKNTLVINHSPIRFNAKDAIDLAVFGEPTKDFVIPERDKKKSKTTKATVMRKGSVAFTLDEVSPLVKAGYPIAVKKKNVGDKNLRNLLRKKKAIKFICGDIHEAGQRANDSKGKKVKEGQWSRELFYNCAPGFKGRAGIFEAKAGLAKFKNIRV